MKRKALCSHELIVHKSSYEPILTDDVEQSIEDVVTIIEEYSKDGLILIVPHSREKIFKDIVTALLSSDKLINIKIKYEYLKIEDILTNYDKEEEDVKGAILIRCFDSVRNFDEVRFKRYNEDYYIYSSNPDHVAYDERFYIDINTICKDKDLQKKLLEYCYELTNNESLILHELNKVECRIGEFKEVEIPVFDKSLVCIDTVTREIFLPIEPEIITKAIYRIRKGVDGNAEQSITK